jgi:hydrogenase expression/formation protein HypE
MIVSIDWMARPKSCPIPISEYPHILMAHGGGGRLMKQLIEKMFVSAFQNESLNQQHDSSVVDIKGARLAFTTDSFVVKPLFFPGGDIGSLAVHGTVNDLAMSGARPLYLSAGFIIEEGLPMETLWQIVASMQKAAQDAGVQIITGDTKVVDREKGDGVYINTAGIGVIEHAHDIKPTSVKAGDKIIVSGDLGRHGIAVMASREGLNLATPIESDSAPLHRVVLDFLGSGVELHCLRDLTRGGLSSALNEIAQSCELRFTIDVRKIAITEPVRGVCELLGFDPLYVANEGRFVAFVPESQADRALAVMARHEVSREASIIGEVNAADSSLPPVSLSLKSAPAGFWICCPGNNCPASVR